MKYKRIIPWLSLLIILLAGLYWKVVLSSTKIPVMRLAAEDPITTFVQSIEPDRYDPWGFSSDPYVYDPFWSMERMHRHIEDMFRSFGQVSTGSPFSGASGQGTSFMPNSDFHETDKAYVAEVDLPGMEKSEIKIEAKNNMLMISGERKNEREENDPSGVYRYERSFGTFTRTFRLPDDANVDKITADYANGVLKINIPKTESKPAKSIQII